MGASGQVKAAVRRLRAQLEDQRYHARHRAEAAAIVRRIESYKGKVAAELFRRADAYAADALGWRGYAPWLKVYAAVSGTFKDGWIPDNYYGRVVMPLVNGRYRQIAGAKTFLNRVLQSNRVPDLAYVLHGRFYSRELKPLTESELRRVLFARGDRAVFKPEGASRGRNFRVLRPSDLDLSEIKRLGNGVFQEFVRQHEFFDGIVSSSVATLRITTAIAADGIASPRASYLRVGRAADACVQSSSHVRIPVSIRTGQLGTLAYMPDWSTVEKHPDTGFAFAGATIPYINGAFKAVCDLHASFPHLTCIGWDAAIDAAGQTQILEWNAVHNDIKFSEAVTGPCFTGLGWEDLWRTPN